MAEFLILASKVSVLSANAFGKAELWNLLCYTTWHCSAVCSSHHVPWEVAFLYLFFFSWWGQFRENKDITAEVISEEFIAPRKRTTAHSSFSELHKCKQRKFVDSGVAFHIWQFTQNIMSCSRLSSHVSTGNEAWSNHKIVIKYSKHNSSFHEKSQSNFSVS